MASAPQYTASAKVGMGIVSAANTLRDGTGTIVTIFTAGTSGSRIEDVYVKAQGVTTAGMIRLFLSDGTNVNLLTEIDVTPSTPSNSVKSFEAQLTIAMPIPNGYSLGASTHNAETFNVIVNGGDF